MLRLCASRTLAILYFAFILTAISPLRAADPGGAVCSVEKLRMLLHSIDPYMPNDVVSGEIHIFGSATMDGLAHAWGENFQEFHPKSRLEKASMSESAGAQRLIDEPSGIWMVSRPVRQEELESLKTKGLKEPVAFEVAREALGVFVHPSNPVPSISGEQLRAVFTAEGTANPTWRILGATGKSADEPIRIVSRKDDSGTQRYLQEVVFGTQLRTGEIVESNSKVVSAIEKDPLSIGICGLKCGSLQARALHLEAGGNTIPSDDLAILSGQYPLIRPLTIVIDLGSPESKRTIEFVRYILSQSGQAENVLAGYFPIDLPLIRAEVARLQEVRANLR